LDQLLQALAERRFIWIDQAPFHQGVEAAERSFSVCGLSLKIGNPFLHCTLAAVSPLLQAHQEHENSVRCNQFIQEGVHDLRFSDQARDAHAVASGGSLLSSALALVIVVHDAIPGRARAGDHDGAAAGAADQATEERRRCVKTRASTGRLPGNQKFLHAIELVTRDDHRHRDLDDGLGPVFATGLAMHIPRPEAGV
jgi:hypothetical protein